MVTGAGDPALSGVYKIAARRERDEWIPTIKVSNNPEKVTNPGVKQVWRFSGNGGSPIADLICLEDEKVEPGRPYTFHHPMVDYRSFTLADYDKITPLLRHCMSSGRTVQEPVPLADIQATARAELDRLDDTYKRLINPHVYKVSLSNRLNELKSRLIQKSLSRGASK